MPGYPIAVALIFIGFTVIAAARLSGYPMPCAFGGFVAFLAVAAYFKGVEERRRTNLHEAAIDEWHREFGERMRIELARGVTDTMAQFMVAPVMERTYPHTYEDAVAYLDSRGLLVQDADGRIVPAEPRGPGMPMPFR